MRMVFKPRLREIGIINFFALGQVLLIFISKRVCVNVLSLYSGFEEGFVWGFT